MRSRAVLVLVALTVVGLTDWRTAEIGADLATPASAPLLPTGRGPALRIGPDGVVHAVGLLATGGGAVGIAVADDGSFLAFTCGMRPQVESWFSGDWYQGRLEGDRPVEVMADDGERLELRRDAHGYVRGRLVAADGITLPVEAGPAAPEDGLFRRDDADGVLGAIGLPGNTVCAVKRTVDGRLEPAGTVPY